MAPGSIQHARQHDLGYGAFWTRRHEISPRHQWFREIGKTHPDANVAAWLNSVDDADLAISALTVREVRKGIVKLAAKKPDVAAQIEARVRDF